MRYALSYLTQPYQVAEHVDLNRPNYKVRVPPRTPDIRSLIRLSRQYHVTSPYLSSQSEHERHSGVLFRS